MLKSELLILWTLSVIGSFDVFRQLGIHLHFFIDPQMGTILLKIAKNIPNPEEKKKKKKEIVWHWKMFNTVSTVTELLVYYLYHLYQFVLLLFFGDMSLINIVLTCYFCRANIIVQVFCFCYTSPLLIMWYQYCSFLMWPYRCHFW